jgi:hypothetical protein
MVSARDARGAGARVRVLVRLVRRPTLRLAIVDGY